MVGQIGGLARISSNETDKAADIARVWTGGWQKGDQAAIGKKLDEIQAAVANNQKVYDLAAAALKELSAGKAAFETYEAQTRKELVGTAEQIAAGTARLTLAKRVLADAEADHAQTSQTVAAAQDAAATTLDKREKAVEAAEKQNTAKDKALTKRETAIEAAEAVTVATAAKLADKLARIEAIAAE